MQSPFSIWNNQQTINATAKINHHPLNMCETNKKKNVRKNKYAYKSTDWNSHKFKLVVYQFMMYIVRYLQMMSIACWLMSELKDTFVQREFVYVNQNGDANALSRSVI